MSVTDVGSPAISLTSVASLTIGLRDKLVSLMYVTDVGSPAISLVSAANLILASKE